MSSEGEGEGEDSSPPREISFLQQQQLFFRRAITHFTNPDLYLYTGQTRDEIPDDVLHVRVDPCVRVIEWDTFAGCKNMKTIELPHGLVRIMGRAFIDCYALQDPQIPPTVKEIGDMAFSTCLGMNSLDLPEGLERIGRAAFPSCSFRNVKIPKTMTEVGDKVFSCCTDLISIEIPLGVTAIQREAFFQCLELRNVAIPETVNVIGDNAFECCFKLQDKFAEEESLIEALRRRFDDLPLHRIIYYHAHQDTEDTLQELSQALMDMEALETVGGERSGSMRQQDAFDMTPIHILAMSKKQDLELYQFLVETYPEDLSLQDAWGYLPIYYACLCNAPLEIVQYLLDTHKQKSEKTGTPQLDWETIVDSFSVMFVSADTLKCIILWTISERMERVHYPIWKEEIMHEINMIPDGGRRVWKLKENRISAAKEKLALYELREITSLLEMAAWNCKVQQSIEVMKEEEGAETTAKEQEIGDGETKRLSDTTTATSTLASSERSSTSKKSGEGSKLSADEDLDTTQARTNCRINSGAELIISNVLPYCLYPVKLDNCDLDQSFRR